MSYDVAVLGATGLVGRELLRILDQRSFPAGRVRVLASARSAGSKLRCGEVEVEVVEATPAAFEGVDIVLASAGGQVSERLAPEAVARGAVVIDNTSAFRMEPDVPLVVPEVNGHRIADHRARGIIANPNCSTIQLVVALKPLHDLAGLRRVLVSTYQSVSGAGADAVTELREETRSTLAGESYQRTVFPHPIAFNALPHIDVFLEDGDTREEWKMRVETAKILEADIPVHATCVRVPSLNAHAEAVWIETERPLSPDDARNALAAAPGVEVVDDPATLRYPTAVDASGRDQVLVGRVRRDPTIANGLAMWIVADNLRKGAALNAVQIAEGLVASWRADGG